MKKEKKEEKKTGKKNLPSETRSSFEKFQDGRKTEKMTDFERRTRQMKLLNCKHVQEEFGIDFERTDR